MIAQLLAALAVLAGIYIALGIVATFGLSGGSDQFEAPWWTGILRFCTIFLFYTFPALGYHFVHSFFFRVFKSSGYSKEYPRLSFRRLLLCIFATITIASNVLFWAMVIDHVWLPPYLESVLGFGIIQSAIVTACITATLFPDCRRTFWWGVGFVVASIVSLVLQQMLLTGIGYSFMDHFLNQ